MLLIYSISRAGRAGIALPATSVKIKRVALRFQGTEARADVPRRPSSGACAGYWIVLLALQGTAMYAQSRAEESRAGQSPAERSPSDSADVRRRARNAQRDFESIRRLHLPADPQYGSHGCDEHVGRFCYWYEPSNESTLREPDAITAARERLLRHFATAAGRIPGDGWIAGQRVRYLVEHGLADSAVAVAQACQARRWWCDALDGFAHHLARDYPGADRAFARALLGMPESRWCAWTDLTSLLGDGRESYQKLSCVERQPVNERIWWLAHPLYARPGNDLRTEHFARHTMDLLLQDAATADGLRWGDDSRQLIVRFGWPTLWSRVIDRSGRAEPLNIIGHEPSPSFWLLPAPAITDPWVDATAMRWDPGLERPPARYAPPYAKSFGAIEHVQFARFRRHDSTLTIAALDLTGDSIFATRTADIHLAVARDPETSPIIARDSLTVPSGVLAVHSAWRPAVVSLEVLASDTPWVARRRTMTAADPASMWPAVSDILLVAPADDPPETLEAALPLALSRSVVTRERPLGLYWELYDAPDSLAVVEITVTATKVDSNHEEPYPLGRPSCPRPNESIRLHWREEPGMRPPGVGRAITLDPRSLDEGDYVIAVQIRVAGETRGCSSREIRLR